MKYLLPLALGLVLALAGCSTLSQVLTPTGELISGVAIDIAVGRVIGNGTSADARAAVIRGVAQELLAIDKGDSVTVVAVEAALNAKVAALHLNPADAQAAADLGAAFTVAVTSFLQKSTAGVLPTSQVAIAFVLTRVITACSGYVAPPLVVPSQSTASGSLTAP